MEAPNLGLLLAISMPVAAVLALHTWLAIHGERGTLLVPDTGEYEAISCPACVLGAKVKAAARARIEESVARIAAANDGVEREAA